MILEEVMPTDRWEVKSVKQVRPNSCYLVHVEDEEYHYKVELELTPVRNKEGEEIRSYRLLSFEFEEKEQKTPEEKKGKRARGPRR